MTNLKSKRGFHFVWIGKGCWIFDTLTDALNFIAERCGYEPK